MVEALRWVAVDDDGAVAALDLELGGTFALQVGAEANEEVDDLLVLQVRQE